MILVQLSDTAVTMAAVMVAAETEINKADSTTQSAMTGLITVRWIAMREGSIVIDNISSCASATSKPDETAHVFHVL